MEFPIFNIPQRFFIATNGGERHQEVFSQGHWQRIYDTANTCFFDLLSKLIQKEVCLDVK